jgi:hypothetical protein
VLLIPNHKEAPHVSVILSVHEEATCATSAEWVNSRRLTDRIERRSVLALCAKGGAPRAASETLELDEGELPKATT